MRVLCVRFGHWYTHSHQTVVLVYNGNAFGLFAGFLPRRLFHSLLIPIKTDTSRDGRICLSAHRSNRWIPLFKLVREAGIEPAGLSAHRVKDGATDLDVHATNTCLLS